MQPADVSPANMARSDRSRDAHCVTKIYEMRRNVLNALLWVSRDWRRAQRKIDNANENTTVEGPSLRGALYV